ncbi:MAG: ribbon-helix-helix protein, CopG family [Candidatus Bathyarchaeia archaeon]
MPEGTVTSSTYSAKEEDKRIVVTVRVPDLILEELDEQAKRSRVSRSKLIKQAIVEFLGRERKKLLELESMKIAPTDREKREKEFQKLREEYWRKRLTDPEFRPEDWEQVA